MREYLNELKNRRRRRRQARIAMVILISLVAGSVIGALAQYGVAMTGNAKCGIEEHQHELACYEKTLVCTQTESEGHQHTDVCYQTETSLVCGLEESEEHTHSDACYVTEQQLICSEEEGAGHQHTDACYEEELACGKELHTHGEECYIDTDADVEDAAVWNKQYEKLEWKDTWSENLVLAAREQIGYKESSDNYTIAEDGSHKGYTRYGQFAVDTGVEAADVYADWDTAFVNFCLFYAGLSTTDIFPDKLDTVEWYEEFRKINENIDEYLSCLVAPEGYTPKAGDIVIFQKGIEEEEREYQMGIVSSYDKEKDELKVIEGNSGNEVKENDYYIEAKDAQDDEMAPVFCYLDMSGLEKAYKGTDEEPEDPVEPGEPVEPEDPEEPKDDVTEEEDPAEDSKEENPDGETDGEEDPEEEEPEEETIELTTKVDGTTITLSGPASSFEEGKNYEIQAEKVEDEETIATIEEAIDKEVEKQEKKVENYQAFDIKLLLDGEEVQPLGPVEVKFSGKEVKKSVENEETEVSVLHVDEETGEATDMEATATEEKEVVIETEHFSVYVYVEVGVDAIGGVKINIQHWGENIETIDSSAGGLNGGKKEEAFDTEKCKVITKTGKWKLYSTDLNFSLPSETYMDVRKLSKVYNADKGKRYEITKIWVSMPGKEGHCEEDEASWGQKDVDYKEYSKSQLSDGPIVEEINSLKEGSVIRFWYAPPEEKESVKEPVTFYDYDHSLQNGNTLNTQGKGINASQNFKNNGKPKLGVGQSSAGNASSWINNTYNGKYLNAGNNNLEFKGLVEDKLKNGKLVFNSNIDVPGNLFSHDPTGGSHQYNDYKLEFLQNGDTYTLTNVYKGDTKTYAQNLTTFKSMPNWNKTRYVYSNDFWPLDEAENKKDPLLGEKVYQISPPSTTTNGNKLTKIGRDSAGNGQNDFQTANGHNWYFGMTYSVRFTLGDYTGPLEYYFRGDDDFWLFVDGELVVDLGGIHTAIGTTCNLDYLKEQDKNKEHVLQVYYMERGATGSTCYMQFTLPKAKIEPIPEPKTTSYTVKKEWADNENGFRPQDIQITLYKQKANEERVAVRTITLPLKNDEGKYIDQNGNVVNSPVWSYTWNDLPEIDGKTGQKITYDADEEYIDPENESNPMLGYDYDKIINPDDSTQITLRNWIKDKKVKVRKEWKDDDKELENRPDQVEFELYANGQVYHDYLGRTRRVTLNENNRWEDVFDHVPEYYYNLINQKWEKVVYSVKEVPTKPSTNEIDGKNDALYEIVIEEITTDEDRSKDYIACFKATNTLITKNICIEKIGTSTGFPHLIGAVFDLYNENSFDENGILLEGANAIGTYETGANGRIDIGGLRFGTYYLLETKAPPSHTLLEKPIKIVATKEGVTVDFQIAGWDSDSHVKLENGKYVITIPNEIMYELPSTGGPGTYWYMFSGVLLLAITALITYRNKRKEVLRS